MIDDIDIGTDDVRVTLSILNEDLSGDDGVLSLGSSSNVSVTGDGTTLLTIEGMIDDVRDALNSLVFTPPTGISGDFTLSYDIVDLSTVDELSDGGTLLITVNS
jgi:hypothetical protein